MTELDKAVDNFKTALARNEFCYHDAKRKGDRQTAEYYENQLKWRNCVNSMRKNK